MRDFMTGKKEGVEEFAKELAVLMRLHHEHIVKFFGVYMYMDTANEDEER